MPDSRGWACLAALLLLSACSPREDPVPPRPEAPAPAEVEHYDCYAIGQLQGIMVQQSGLGEVHPGLDRPIRSRWLLAWSSQWTAEVVREGGGARVRSRTFEHARSVELMFPVDLGEPRQTADPGLSPAVVSLASRLAALQPEGFEDEPSSVLLQSESFDLAEVLALIGVEPPSLEGREISVDATGRIDREREGTTVAMDDRNRGPAWLFGEIKASSTNRVSVTDLPVKDILPYVLAEGSPERNGATLDLKIRYATVEDDRISLETEDAGLSLAPAGGRTNLKDVVLTLARDRTHVRQLSFSTDLPAEILQEHPRFAEVTWEDDLRLDVLYVAVPAE